MSQVLLARGPANYARNAASRFGNNDRATTGWNRKTWKGLQKVCFNARIRSFINKVEIWMDLILWFKKYIIDIYFNIRQKFKKRLIECWLMSKWSKHFFKIYIYEKCIPLFYFFLLFPFNKIDTSYINLI